MSLGLADIPPEVPGRVIDAILKGLPLDADRMAASRKAHDYYDLANHVHLRRSRLEKQDQFESREFFLLPVLRRVIDSMIRMLYPTKPVRKIDPRAEQWLSAIYEEEQIDDLMTTADQYAQIDGAVAIHIYAKGVAPDRTLGITLYAGYEFVPVFDDDPLNPFAVVTISEEVEEDGRIEKYYEIWTDDVHAKGKPCEKRKEMEWKILPEPNIYGCLPFEFGHAKRPIRSFWEGGYGDYLSRLNAAADGKASDTSLTESQSLPTGWMKAEPGKEIVAGAGTYNLLKEGEEPPVYTSPEYDAITGVDTMKEWVFFVTGMLGVPRSELEGSVDSGESGIAILLKRLPLYELAMQRQPRWSRTEREMARLAWRIGVSQGLVAPTPDPISLSMLWPPPSVPLKTPDAVSIDQIDLDARLASRTSITMRDYGVSRETAQEMLRQIDADEQEIIDGTALADAPVAIARDPGANRYDIATHLAIASPGADGAGSDPSLESAGV